jgi:hypothetical protein
MNTHPLSEQWRQDAALLRRHGAIEAATTKEMCADEFDADAIERGLEHLTLSEAAKESGYSAAHIARLLESGRLPNAGEKYAPRICRNDLPKKPPKAPAPQPSSDGVDLVEAVLSGQTRPNDKVAK